MRRSIRTAYSVLEGARTTGKSSHRSISVAVDHATLESHVERGLVGLLASASPRPTGSRPSSRSASPPAQHRLPLQRLRGYPWACTACTYDGHRLRADRLLGHLRSVCQGSTPLRRCEESIKMSARLLHLFSCGMGPRPYDGEGIGQGATTALGHPSRCAHPSAVVIGGGMRGSKAWGLLVRRGGGRIVAPRASDRSSGGVGIGREA